MSIDDPVAPEEALIQRYFDGTLTDEEAEAFEARMDREPALADAAARFGSLFAALEMRGSEAPAQDLTAAAVARWSPAAAAGMGALTRLFVGLDVLLGAGLVALAMIRGPRELLVSWVLGLKDLAVLAHGLALAPEQAALGLVAGLGAVVLLLGVTGFSLGRAFLGAGAEA